MDAIVPFKSNSSLTFFQESMPTVHLASMRLPYPNWRHDGKPALRDFANPRGRQNDSRLGKSRMPLPSTLRACRSASVTRGRRLLKCYDEAYNVTTSLLHGLEANTQHATCRTPLIVAVACLSGKPQKGDSIQLHPACCDASKISTTLDQQRVGSITRSGRSDELL
ncbi:hypothetical protein BV22DRAFT_170073 [Leucogyrophana mollusca]|uniref:Uncharacterized protein n=1 Tax=Leucogyrophana mollusca TaxID=85980 RepID=A0ACB8BTR1_9AGAM|nr:hypothetical protein BV22DRAFT_170073 [Leucogyrophana mollusca]